MRAIRAILLGGLVAGALDIIYAIVIYGPLSYGVPAMRILQSVGAGFIGRDASRAGEWGTALFGLGTHFLLAMIIAAIFVLASNALGTLKTRPILWGFLYGLVAYVMMNYVVSPLSAAGEHGHFAASISEATARLQESFSEVRGGAADYPWMLWGTIFTHTVLVGIPIAVINARVNPQQA
jgi:uncharacterized membrane protein YagU involved in acid resistance